MNTKFKNYGFSLVEVLMAVGILTVGLLLIATMFPAAIYMTSVASERTMAAVVADEAFAKIQLYGHLDGMQIDVHNDPNNCYDWGDEMEAGGKIAPSEFAYPPVDPNSAYSQYFWAALYKKTPGNDKDNEYQITVFVARRTNPGLTYLDGADDGNGGQRPVLNNDLTVSGAKDSLTMLVAGSANLINPPAAIVVNDTGKLYIVVKRGEDDIDEQITLDRKLESVVSGSKIWLLPPPTSGGKNAGIEVYQRIIKF